jgi:uncharacterized protein YggE
MADESQLDMRSDAELVVRGEFATNADPEIGFVTTELTARARRREDVFERLRERAEWQRGVIERFAEQIERDEVAVHHVHPLIDRVSSEMPVGYVGEIRTKITVKELSSVGDLVSALSLGDGSDVISLAWALRPNSSVHRSTRIAAVHDAIAKARDYCAAVGSQLTGLIRVTEADEESSRPQPAQAARIVATPEHPPGAAFDFRPTPLLVRSVIEARFTMLQPKFG